MAIYIKIGDAMHPSEEMVCNYLAEKLPDNYKIFSNFKVQAPGREIDIDAAVITPHAIYVVEIKAIGGEIICEGREWKVRSNGYRLRDPLDQAKDAAQAFLGCLSRFYLPFRDVPVQSVVCTASEEKPYPTNLQPERKRRVVWYRLLDEYLTNPQFLERHPVDLRPDYALIDQAFEKNFFVPNYIKNFRIDGGIWVSDYYRAYAASSKDFPYRHILKVYDLPISERPADVYAYIEDLKRELNALRTISDSGDPASGGENNVVVAREAFTTQKNHQYVIVIDWVEGVALSLLMRRNDLLSSKEKYSIAAQACRGLAFAHSAGVIHRNLHPGNILRTKQDQVKLVNFDFARFTGQTFPVGTVTTGDLLRMLMIKEYRERKQYLAPEIFPSDEEIKANETLTEAFLYHRANELTDIFALGVILWELFCGEEFDSSRAANLKPTETGMDKTSVDLILKLCSPDPKKRKEVSLVDAAEIFERLSAGQKPQDDSLPILSPGEKFLSYIILERLSTTESSTTYKAENEFEGQVVIKFIQARTTEEARSLMKRAYALLQKIDPTYTAKWKAGATIPVRQGRIVIDGNKAHQVYYQVFEFIAGENLKDFIARGVPTPAEALQIGLEALKALCAVHQVGWTHQDVKPDNFMLTPEKRVKIIDFGLSRRVEDPVYLVHESLGYTPREVSLQAGDQTLKNWTPAGDVYSMACVILSLICGESLGPYNGPIVNWPVVQQTVGNEILSILERDYSSPPEGRHPTAIEMLADFQPAVERFLNKTNIPNTSTANNLPSDEIKPLPGREDEEDVMPFDEARLTNIIADLKKRADNVFETDLSLYTKYHTDADLLQRWLTSGMIDPCPVDLESLGYGTATEGGQPSSSVVAITEGEVDAPPAAAVPIESTIEPVIHQPGQAGSSQQSSKELIDAVNQELPNAHTVEELNRLMIKVDQVLSDEPDHPLAIAIMQELLTQKENVQKESLIDKLHTSADQAELENAIREAEELLKGAMFDDQELRQAYIEAVERSKVIGEQHLEEIPTAESEVQPTTLGVRSGLELASQPENTAGGDQQASEDKLLEIRPVDSVKEINAVSEAAIEDRKNFGELSSGEVKRIEGRIPPIQPLDEASRLRQIESLMKQFYDNLFKASTVDDCDFLVIILNQVLDLDLEYPEALAGRQIIRERREVISIKETKEKLRTSLDTKVLRKAEKAAAEFLASRPEDLELRDLVKSGEERRQSLEEARRERTSSEIVNDLKEVNQTVFEIEKAITHEVETWPDDRYGGAERPIDDVLQDFKNIQRKLSVDDAEKKQVSIKESLPDCTPERPLVREPITALKVLNEALELEALLPAEKKKLELQQKEIQKEVDLWNEAGRLREEANQAEDNFKKLAGLRNARKIYPYHKELIDLSVTIGDVCRTIEKELTDAIETGNKSLEKEPGEAADQRRKNRVAALPVYQNTRQSIELIMGHLSIISENERTTSLKETLDRTQLFLAKLDEAEKWRNSIREVYGQISPLIEAGNGIEAKDKYELLEAAYKADPEIKYLREQLDTFYDLKDLLKEAEQQRAESLWLDCKKTCERIIKLAKPREDDVARRAQETASGWHYEARLHELRLEIEDAWERKDYETAREKIRDFKAQQPPELKEFKAEQSALNVKEEIGFLFNLAGKETNLLERRKVDQEQNILRRYERLKAEAEDFTQKIKAFDGQPRGQGSSVMNKDKSLRQLDRIYAELTEIYPLESSYVYRIRVLRDETGGFLHDTLIDELNSARTALEKAETPSESFDFTRPYEQASILHEHSLTRPREIDLRRWAVIGYFRQQARDLEKNQQFTQIVRNWEKAYHQFPIVVEVRKELDKARHNCMLAALDEAILQSNYDQAIKLLDGVTEDCIFDKDIPYAVHYHEKPDLYLRYQVASVLKEAQELFEQKKYLELTSRLDELIQPLAKLLENVTDNDRDRSLLDFLGTRRQVWVNQATQDLMREGQRMETAGNIRSAVGKYAEVLRIDPNFLRARTRITVNQEEVREAITQDCKTAENAPADIGLTHLDRKVAEFQNLEKQLLILQAACNYLDEAKNRESGRLLKNAIENIGRLNKELRNCQLFRSILSPDGDEWRRICREGDWTEAENKRDYFIKTLTPQHDESKILTDRIKHHKNRRNDLDSLKNTLVSGFKEDRFDVAEEACKKINEALKRNAAAFSSAVTYPPADPYGLIASDFSIYDELFEKYIPLFAKDAEAKYEENSPDEELPITALIQRRAKNFNAWEKCYKDIAYESKKVLALTDDDQTPSPYEKLDRNPLPRPPTKPAMNSLKKYCHACCSIRDKASQDLESRSEPISLAASNYRKECKDIVELIEKEIKSVQRDISDCEDYERVIQTEIDDAVRYLTDANYQGANSSIDRPMEFYRDSLDPNWDFLAHFALTLSLNLA